MLSHCASPYTLDLASLSMPIISIMLYRDSQICISIPELSCELQTFTSSSLLDFCTWQFHRHFSFSLSKVELVNRGLWVIMMCLKVSSLVATNVQLWWGMLIMREAVHDWGQEYMGDLCIIPSVLL